MKLFSFKKNKKVEAPNFFDLPSRDKKKIIKKAVQESSKEQLRLLKKYGYVYNLR